MLHQHALQQVAGHRKYLRSTPRRPLCVCASTGAEAKHWKRRSATRKRQPSAIDKPSWFPDKDDVSRNDELDAIDAWGGYQGSPVALNPEPSDELINAQDKNRLKPHLRSELSRRLRREAPERGVVAGRIRVLRVFRFALDDLRLYKAIHQADMEGRIIVVDNPEHANVVIAAKKTRTGREVPSQNARNMAEKLNIPLVILDKVSGFTLMEAVSPIMGIRIPQHLLQPRYPPLPVLPSNTQTEVESQKLASILNGSTLHPTLNTADAVETASSAAGMPGQKGVSEALYRAGGVGEVAGEASASTVANMTIAELLRLSTTTACSASSGRTMQRPSATASLRNTSGGPLTVEATVKGVGNPVLDSRSRTDMTPTQQDAPTMPFSVVASTLHVPVDAVALDVEDNRQKLLPSNPTYRLGEKYSVHKPLKHGAQKRRQKRIKEASEQQQQDW